MKLTCGKLMQQVDKTGSFSWWADRVSAIPPPHPQDSWCLQSRPLHTSAQHWGFSGFADQSNVLTGRKWVKGEQCGGTPPFDNSSNRQLHVLQLCIQRRPQPVTPRARAKVFFFFSFSPDTVAVRYECNQLLVFVFFSSFLYWFDLQSWWFLQL